MTTTNDKVDLAKGGVAVVLVGHTGFVKEYATNPAIKFIDCKTIPGERLESEVPNNTKAAILTEGIPQYHSTWIFSYCKRRQIPYLIRKSNQAVYDTLRSFFPNGNASTATQEEARETRQHGKLDVLISDIDWTKSNAENARALERIARQKNIKTTFGSLAQFVANQRRKTKHGIIPKSARSRLDISVEVLDTAIKELSDIREFLISTCEENRLLRDKVEKFKKLAGD